MNNVNVSNISMNILYEEIDCLFVKIHEIFAFRISTNKLVTINELDHNSFFNLKFNAPDKA